MTIRMGQLDSKLLMESWSLRHLSHEHPRPLPSYSNVVLWTVGPIGAVSCAASIAPWPRPPRFARLPQRWPDRAQSGTADRLRPAARAHPARQLVALIPACFAARVGSYDDCSSPQV